MHIRALEPTDLEFLYELENDLELWAASDLLAAPVSRYALTRYLENATAGLAEAGQLRLLICADAEASQPVGTLDLYDYSALHARAGVGITVLKNARRQGHARRALEWLVPYARHTLHLHQLYCAIVADNEASLTLFQSVGFERVGTRREWLRGPAAGQWLDSVEMQRILR